MKINVNLKLISFELTVGMSITNRFPIIENIIENKQLFIGKSKWTLTIIATRMAKYDKKMIEYFYNLTFKNMMNDILVEQICFYTCYGTENSIEIRELADKLDSNIKKKIRIFEISDIGDNEYLKLSIALEKIRNGMDVILIDYGYGFINQSRNKILFNEGDIYVKIIKPTDLDALYSATIKKFGMREIIDTSIIIIPHSIRIIDCIAKSLMMANQIEKEFGYMTINTAIALTIVCNKMNVTIKDLMEESFGINFVSYDDQTTRNLNKELNTLRINEIPKFEISLDTENYLFYPHLDVNTDGLELNYLGSNIFSPKLFNTNGFYVTDKKITDNPYYSMFKRFHDPKMGIYVKKNINAKVIPQILHHIWLKGDPNTKYINAWKRILREPWKYILWTEENLFTDILNNNNRWTKIYQNETNQKVKNIIAKLSILERYGGLLIDSSVIPTKNISDDFLMNKFIIGFLNEKEFGTKLSFRIIASVPGEYKYTGYGTVPSIINPARRPFEKYGYSNIKIENKREENDIDINNTSTIMIFEDLYRKMIEDNQEDRIAALENIIIHNSDVTIYPSYYFSTNYDDLPMELRDLTMCIRLMEKNKERKFDRYQKTEPQRSYIITNEGIVSRLRENPRDRLLNTNRILHEQNA